ncbi:MAG: hypothetical protein H0T52_11470 [Lautropia sp.]|nr:hypothetical protein [Lautropia sp.]
MGSSFLRYADVWGLFCHEVGSVGKVYADFRHFMLQALFSGGTAWSVVFDGEYQIGWAPNWKVVGGTSGMSGDAEKYTDIPGATTLGILADPNNQGYSTHFTLANDLVFVPDCENIIGIISSCQARLNTTRKTSAGAKGLFHIGMDPKPVDYPTDAGDWGMVEPNKYFVNSCISHTIRLTPDWRDVTASPLVFSNPTARQQLTSALSSVRPKNSIA